MTNKLFGHESVSLQLTEKINKAKSQIITFETLPPQIDYVLPWKMKADKAVKFIETLPEKIQSSIMKQISDAVDEYYGENGAAQYDCLF